MEEESAAKYIKLTCETSGPGLMFENFNISGG
jgi:hypothetical protein